MISKNQIKHIQSLHRKKFRDIHHEFIAEGSKIVLDLIQSPFNVKQVFALKNWSENNRTHFYNKTVQVSEVNQIEMEQISTLTSTSPVLAIIEIPENPESPIPEKGRLYLMLDEIKDPGNLGTIIRIADWFGIETIFCSKNTVELYNPKVVQATMGSIARVNVLHLDLVDLIRKKDPETQAFGAYLSGENIYTCHLPEHGIIVVGNEADGISEQLDHFIDKRIFIPAFPKTLSPSLPESLNVASATAIICSEFRRTGIENQTRK